MVETVDLIQLANTIPAPYQPEPVVAFDDLAVSVVVYQGPKSWHREARHDEMLVVLEGVVTIDSPDGLVVVNEGELVRVPARAVFDYNSGMHSAALLMQEPVDPEEDGADLLVPVAGGHVSKSAFATDVRQSSDGSWRSVGKVGGFEAHASRVCGAYAPFTAPAGGVVAVVYRGVLDVGTSDSTTSIVGGELLAAPSGERLRFRSERGATAMVVQRAGSAMPSRLGG